MHLLNTVVKATALLHATASAAALLPHASRTEQPAAIAKRDYAPFIAQTTLNWAPTATPTFTPFLYAPTCQTSSASPEYSDCIAALEILSGKSMCYASGGTTGMVQSGSCTIAIEGSGAGGQGYQCSDLAAWGRFVVNDCVSGGLVGGLIEIAPFNDAVNGGNLGFIVCQSPV